MSSLQEFFINLVACFVVLRLWGVGGPLWKRQLSLAFVLATTFYALHALQGSMLETVNPRALTRNGVRAVASEEVVVTERAMSAVTRVRPITSSPGLSMLSMGLAGGGAAPLVLKTPLRQLRGAAPAAVGSPVAVRRAPNRVGQDGEFIAALSISPFPAGETDATMRERGKKILAANPQATGFGVSNAWGLQVYSAASLPLVGASGWTAYMRETDPVRAAASLAAEQTPQMETSDAAVKAYLATFPPGAAVAVLVHCGPSLNHGWHSLVAIDQLRRVNPHVPILWMLNAAATHDGSVQAAAKMHQVQIVEIETLSDALAKRLEEVFFVSGDMSSHNAHDFNLITTKRLFYVRAAAEKFGLRNIFHIENDNMVYVDLNAYLPTLRACTVRLATTARELHNVRPTMVDGSFFVLGFMYIRDEAALRAMLEHFVALLALGERAVVRELRTDQVNDMSLAAHYFIASVERKGLAQSLAAPITILPEREDLSSGALAQQRCIMEKTPLVFDNAAIAIWNFGNFHDKKPRNELHNAWGAYSRIPAQSYDLSWETIPGHCRKPVLKNRATGKAFGVGSLHVHSKQLEQLLSTGCPA